MSSKSTNSSFEREKSFDSLQRDSLRDLDNWGKKREEISGSPSGDASPRLVLQLRSVPLSEEAKRESPVAKPKGSNSFGVARRGRKCWLRKGKTGSRSLRL